MNEFDKEFFTNRIERVINAYYCGVSHLPDKRCKKCPYDYGYLDDMGDNTFWWCDYDQLEEDAMKLLYILKEKI